MKTSEINTDNVTRYYIDYVINKDQIGRIDSCYYQLVRRSDDAILYANEDLDNVFLHCFHAGISAKDIVIL